MFAKSLQCLGAVLCVANGGETAEAVAPNFLTGGEADVGLGRALVGVPIILVLVADGIEVHWESGVPVGAVFRVGHTGEVWHEGDVRARVVHRDDTADLELAGAFLELTHGSDGVVAQFYVVADFGLQIVRGPLVQPDGARFKIRQRRGHRVWRGAFADLNLVDEIGEHLGGVGIDRECGLGQGRIDKHARRA